MTAPKMELRRAQEPAPTEPGWYYATLPEGENIIPVHLEIYAPNILAAWEPYIEEWLEVDRFIWFGPVPTCIESKS